MLPAEKGDRPRRIIVDAVRQWRAVPDLHFPPQLDSNVVLDKLIGVHVGAQRQI